MVDQNEQLTQAEVDELGTALRAFLNSKDAESILERAQQLVFIEESQAAESSPQMDILV